MKTYSVLFLLLLAAYTGSAQHTNLVAVPLGGNAFANQKSGALITKSGIEQWTDPATFFTVYVRLAKTGTLAVALQAAQQQQRTGTAELSIGINKQWKTIKLANTTPTVAVGEWQIKDTGYVAIHIKGLKKQGSHFPALSQLHLSGSAVDHRMAFVKDNEGNFFYWGRRGPSVHLSYQVPDNTNVEYFYNEVIVPKGEDVQGSYFMTNGFAEGYFGIQVNSPVERRILFSVWSPFQTDNPKEIPEDQQIKLLGKGKDVYTGEFGNEGSGGQSYLKYNWKAGQTYRFLMRAHPAAGNATIYTAYFFDPEENNWRLIASFKRPQIQTWLKRPHSFLENFIPEFGDQQRKVWFKNQWICDDKGQWTPLHTARFTTDNTGSKRYRMDFAGGAVNDAFFLQNCGFFGQFTIPKTMFSLKVTGTKPAIDLTKLP